MKKKTLLPLGIIWIGAVIALAIAYFGREQPSLAGIIPPIIIGLSLFGTVTVLIATRRK